MGRGLAQRGRGNSPTSSPCSTAFGSPRRDAQVFRADGLANAAVVKSSGCVWNFGNRVNVKSSNFTVSGVVTGERRAPHCAWMRKSDGARATTL